MMGKLMTWKRRACTSCLVAGAISLAAPALADEAVQRISAIAARVRNTGARVMGRNLPPVTFSAGVATVPGHGDHADMVIRAADRALYMAKETGRDRILVAHLPGSVE